MQTLKDYIESRFNGSQTDFANSMPDSVTRSVVSRWIKHGSFFVVENKLVQVKHDLNREYECDNG